LLDTGMLFPLSLRALPRVLRTLAQILPRRAWILFRMTGGSDLGTHGTTLRLCAIPRLKEMAVESLHFRDLRARPPELMQAIPGIQGPKTLLRR
jgi:hypothetical protein